MRCPIIESSSLTRSPQPAQGIALLIVSLACFAAFDTLTKYVGTGVPVIMALWFRYMFQMVATGGALLPTRGRSLLRTSSPWMQLLRGLLLVVVSLFSFMSLRYLPVGEVTAIVMLTPLVMTAATGIWTGERVSIWRWSIMAGGFWGAVMVVKPGNSSLDWRMLLPLGLVAANAAFQLVTSRLATIDNVGTTHFYTGCVGVVLLSIGLPLCWQSFELVTWWLPLVMMGLLSTLGHVILILAYARAPVAVLAPYLYMQIGFAMIGGWWVFSHVPDRWAIGGVALIVTCGAASTWVRGREHRTAPHAATVAPEGGA